MKAQKTPREKFKSGLKKAGYDPDAGAKRLLDLIAKQKKEREEFESKYKSAYEGKEMKTLKQIIEGTVVMSDFKLDKKGRKYRAHRSKMDLDAVVREDIQQMEEGNGAYMAAVAAMPAAAYVGAKLGAKLHDLSVKRAHKQIDAANAKRKATIAAKKVQKEEVEQIEELSLKPEHRAAIKRLRPSGEHSKTMLKHSSGKQIHVTREGDKVHFVTHEIGAGTGKKTTMKFSQFDESSDHINEAKESGAMKDGKLQGHMVNFKPKGNLNGDEVVNKVKDIYKSLQSTHPDKVHKGAYSHGYGEYSFNDDHRGPKSGFVVVKSKEHLDAVKKHIKAHGATILEEVDLDESTRGSDISYHPTSGTKATHTVSSKKLSSEPQASNSEVTLESGSTKHRGKSYNFPKGTLFNKLPGGIFAKHPSVPESHPGYGHLIRSNEANINKIHSVLKKQDMSEDVEQVDEISKGSIEKYMNKAVSDFGHQNFMSRVGKGSDKEDASRKAMNRSKGIERAVLKTTKKNMGEDVNPYDEILEARGRPPSAATLAKRAAAASKPREDDDEGEHYDADSGVEADQHIHVQLKKAADSDQKPFEVSFKNGKKHTVSQKVAKDILGATERLKPEHRKNVHDEIHQSYDNLMSVHRLVARK